MTYASMHDIIEANHRLGHHFFDKSSMRFFLSCVESDNPIGGEYFITSEQFVGRDHVPWPRKYTIRRAHPNGDVTTVGDFQEYDTYLEARAAAKNLCTVMRQSDVQG